MKSIFSRLGIPKELVCDHILFASQEMRKFAKSRGTKLTHSNLGYAPSNRLAERRVKTRAEERATNQQRPSSHRHGALPSTDAEGQSPQKHSTKLQYRSPAFSA